MSKHTFPPMDAVQARERIMVLAWCTAIEAPAQANKWAVDARVDWDIVHELRQRFREAGYDVGAAMAKFAKLKRERA